MDEKSAREERIVANGIRKGRVSYTSPFRAFLQLILPVAVLILAVGIFQLSRIARDVQSTQDCTVGQFVATNDINNQIVARIAEFSLARAEEDNAKAQLELKAIQKLLTEFDVRISEQQRKHC